MKFLLHYKGKNYDFNDHINQWNGLLYSNRVMYFTNEVHITFTGNSSLRTILIEDRKKPKEPIYLIGTAMNFSYNTLSRFIHIKLLNWELVVVNNTNRIILTSIIGDSQIIEASEWIM